MKILFWLPICVGMLIVTRLANTSELPVEAFSQLPQNSAPQLSPKGDQIVYKKNFSKEGLTVLTYENISSGVKKYLVKTDNERLKIKWFKWINENIILVSIRYASKRGKVDISESRLLVLEIDGNNVVKRPLLKKKNTNLVSQHISQYQDQIISFLPDDPNSILLALDTDTPGMPSVFRVNVNNGQQGRIQRGRLKIRRWMADRQGNVRLGRAWDFETGEASTRYKLLDDDKWYKIFEYNRLTEPEIVPLGFGLAPNTLYYKAYQNDKKALFKINLKNQESSLVFADENYDVSGSLIYSTKTNDVIGVRHAQSPGGRVYWDKDIGRLQKSLNKALPKTSNYFASFSRDENVYILYSENDNTPGIYYIGDRKEKSLTAIFEQYPTLAPEVLTQHKRVTFTARDGTELEGYLTLPLNTTGPVPTILHPHGGPGSRDYDGFDYWTSFFSNRGYAVFRPNFRGSTGYGYEFAQSQMQGWGLTMQDDLTDAANWLVAENIAIKDKMCIVGASYGGYAAAMAAVKTPDLFKCAISFAGVTDLRALVSRSWNYVNSKAIEKQIGDDADDLKARSPSYNAEKVKISMLFIHGEDDRVVDVKQSRVMVNELQDLDKDVEYIELENGDHYLSIQRNRHATFKAMDAFLKKHLN